MILPILGTLAMIQEDFLVNRQDSSQCCFSLVFALIQKRSAVNEDETVKEQKVTGQDAGPCKATQKGFSEK
ncbi:hypothetical protein STEG23_022003, partial [Scotinomys teguina]